MLIIVSISCCCGARASHTLSTHTTQHLILRYVSYHRFCKHMCAQAITSRSITFATTRNTCAAKMSKIVSSLGHRAVLVSVECTRYTRALWRTLALYHGVQVTLQFWTFFQHLCLVWLLIGSELRWQITKKCLFLLEDDGILSLITPVTIFQGGDTFTKDFVGENAKYDIISIDFDVNKYFNIEFIIIDNF